MPDGEFWFNMARRFLVTTSGLLAAFFLSSGIGSSCAAETAVDIKVDKQPPTVVRRTFNPWNPFEPHPNLEKGQQALTEFSYGLSVGIDDIDVVDQEERHGRWFVHIRPKNVRATLTLPITIWIPQGAPKKCVAHEEGHKVIVERIYEFAGDIISHYAGKTHTDVSPGEGASLELAVKDAHRRSVSDLNKNYRGTVFDYSLMITKEYDRITRHGLNPISEEDAIKQSFDKCSSEMTRLLVEREQAQQPRPEFQGPTTKLDLKQK
ncbi:MAG: hypothetical protein SGJ27_05095 [Candidatus Melainabacteria bacterium]|nr:hypothetical protein [Candidatus Melainabacteria bacterium]